MNLRAIFTFLRPGTALTTKNNKEIELVTFFLGFTVSFFVVADFCLFFWEAIITTQRYFAVVVVPLLGKGLSSDFAIFTSPGPAAMPSMTFFFFFLGLD